MIGFGYRQIYHQVKPATISTNGRRRPQQARGDQNLSRAVCCGILHDISPAGNVPGRLERGVMRSVIAPSRRCCAITGVVPRCKNPVQSRIDVRWQLSAHRDRRRTSKRECNTHCAGYELLPRHRDRVRIRRSYRVSGLPAQIVAAATAIGRDFTDGLRER